MAGHTPSVQAYNSLISACVKSSNYQKAFDVYKGMKVLISLFITHCFSTFRSFFITSTYNLECFTSRSRHREYERTLSLITSSFPSCLDSENLVKFFRLLSFSCSACWAYARWSTRWSRKKSPPTQVPFEWPFSFLLTLDTDTIALMIDAVQAQS